jgi:hypothetical protein
VSGIANISQRIGSKQDHVGDLSGFDRTKVALFAAEARRVDRGAAQGICRR